MLTFLVCFIVIDGMPYESPLLDVIEYASDWETRITNTLINAKESVVEWLGMNKNKEGKKIPKIRFGGEEIITFTPESWIEFNDCINDIYLQFMEEPTMQNIMTFIESVINKNIGLNTTMLYVDDILRQGKEDTKLGYGGQFLMKALGLHLWKMKHKKKPLKEKELKSLQTLCSKAVVIACDYSDFSLFENKGTVFYLRSCLLNRCCCLGGNSEKCYMYKRILSEYQCAKIMFTLFSGEIMSKYWEMDMGWILTALRSKPENNLTIFRDSILKMSNK